MLPMRRLKVGTFKIVSTGFRLGERFFKIIFDNALKSNVDEIYMTLFENKREDVAVLKELMMSWGFYKHGFKNNGELVLRKDLRNYKNEHNCKYNYPLIKNNVNFFILPLYSKYHTDLFPDNILNNENLHLYEDNEPYRYAIEKNYLTGARDIKAKSGDVILIYRNGDREPKKYSSVITGIAIIECIIHTTNVEDCIKECKNRSIFKEEIKELYLKYPTVIKLLDYITFKKKVILKQLQDLNIINEGTGPRPFTNITKKQFKKIYNLGMKDN